MLLFSLAIILIPYNIFIASDKQFTFPDLANAFLVFCAITRH
jgi:hypothetical protein